MGNLIIILIIVLLIIAAIIFWAIKINNRAVLMEESVNTFYNKIGMGVDKRFKILKQGLSIMSQHNENFKATYESIMDKRKKETNYFDQEKDIQKALKEINVLIERYPDIGKVFDSEKLLKDMKEIESEIFNIQDQYNAEAKEYNSFIRVIPNNLILAGKKTYPYFEVSDDEVKEKKNFTI